MPIKYFTWCSPEYNIFVPRLPCICIILIFNPPSTSQTVIMDLTWWLLLFSYAYAFDNLTDNFHVYKIEIRTTPIPVRHTNLYIKSSVIHLYIHVIHSIHPLSIMIIRKREEMMIVTICFRGSFVTPSTRLNSTQLNAILHMLLLLLLLRFCIHIFPIQQLIWEIRTYICTHSLTYLLTYKAIYSWKSYKGDENMVYICTQKN